MKKMLIFGGTTEGRMLAEYCAEKQICADVCVATEYGESVLEKSEFLNVLTGRLDGNEMTELMKNDYFCVFDATHPYAVEVSRNIKKACEFSGTKYYRTIRESSEKCEGAVYLGSAEETALYLRNTQGKIMLTTGSKEVKAFSFLAKRCVVRILDNEENIKICRDAGFENIITGKGPYSEEENIRDFENCRFLVTKDSGKAGGFAEKISAARKLGMDIIIIRRPCENGIDVAEAERIIWEEFTSSARV